MSMDTSLDSSWGSSPHPSSSAHHQSLFPPSLISSFTSPSPGCMSAQQPFSSPSGSSPPPLFSSPHLNTVTPLGPSFYPAPLPSPQDGVYWSPVLHPHQRDQAWSPSSSAFPSPSPPPSSPLTGLAPLSSYFYPSRLSPQPPSVAPPPPVPFHCHASSTDPSHAVAPLTAPHSVQPLRRRVDSGSRTTVKTQRASPPPIPSVISLSPSSVPPHTVSSLPPVNLSVSPCSSVSTLSTDVASLPAAAPSSPSLLTLEQCRRQYESDYPMLSWLAAQRWTMAQLKAKIETLLSIGVVSAPLLHAVLVLHGGAMGEAMAKKGEVELMLDMVAVWLTSGHIPPPLSRAVGEESEDVATEKEQGGRGGNGPAVVEQPLSLRSDGDDSKESDAAVGSSRVEVRGRVEDNVEDIIARLNTSATRWRSQLDSPAQNTLSGVVYSLFHPSAQRFSLFTRTFNEVRYGTRKAEKRDKLRRDIFLRLQPITAATCIAAYRRRRGSEASVADEARRWWEEEMGRHTLPDVVLPNRGSHQEDEKCGGVDDNESTEEDEQDLKPEDERTAALFRPTMEEKADEIVARINDIAARVRSDAFIFTAVKRQLAHFIRGLFDDTRRFGLFQEKYRRVSYKFARAEKQSSLRRVLLLPLEPIAVSTCIAVYLQYFPSKPSVADTARVFWQRHKPNQPLPQVDLTGERRRKEVASTVSHREEDGDGDSEQTYGASDEDGDGDDTDEDEQSDELQWSDSPAAALSPPPSLSSSPLPRVADTSAGQSDGSTVTLDGSSTKRDIYLACTSYSALIQHRHLHRVKLLRDSISHYRRCHHLSLESAFDGHRHLVLHGRLQSGSTKSNEGHSNDERLEADEVMKEVEEVRADEPLSSRTRSSDQQSDAAFAAALHRRELLGLDSPSVSGRRPRVTVRSASFLTAQPRQHPWINPPLASAPSSVVSPSSSGTAPLFSNPSRASVLLGASAAAFHVSGGGKSTEDEGREVTVKPEIDASRNHRRRLRYAAVRSEQRGDEASEEEINEQDESESSSSHSCSPNLHGALLPRRRPRAAVTATSPITADPRRHKRTRLPSPSPDSAIEVAGELSPEISDRSAYGDEHCAWCGEDGEGEVIRCDATIHGHPCPRLYHLACVGITATPSRWTCPWHECSGSLRKKEGGGLVKDCRAEPVQRCVECWRARCEECVKAHGQLGVGWEESATVRGGMKGEDREDMLNAEDREWVLCKRCALTRRSHR